MRATTRPNLARVLVLAAALLAPALLAAPAPEAVRTFYNVVLPAGADPWVTRHPDGTYYLTASNGKNVTLWRSPTLSGIGGGEKRVVWTPPATGPGSRNVWAPELHHLDGKWYVYYAADDGRNENHRMYALVNDNPDPFQGKFVSRGKVFDPQADRWAIDGTVFTLGERRYFVWSGWEGAANVRQNLYIAPMADPVTLAGPRVEISHPTLPWERVGVPHVNEGPQVVVRGRTVNLTYSASGSWTDDYCLGLLTMTVGDDPLAPSSWTKRPRPLFQSGRGVFGPGHASFTRSPDGREDWVVYHAARHRGAGWDRNVRAQPFAWNPDGTPALDAPVAPDRPIPLPGGDPPRARHEAERASLAGAAKPARRPAASGGQVVAGLDAPGGAVEFEVTAAQPGTYLAVVRYGSAKPRDASQRVSVNGRDSGTIRYPDTGKDSWSNAFREVELKAGRNTVRFGHGRGAAEIDCLDLILKQ